MRKVIVNETNFDLSVTLHIRNGFRIRGIEFGTVNFNVAAGDYKEVKYGNLENGYLNGYSCKATVDGRQIEYMEKIMEENSTLDNLLNREDTLRIERLGAL